MRGFLPPLCLALLLSACGVGDSTDAPEAVACRYQGAVVDAAGWGVPHALLTFGRGRIETRAQTDERGLFDRTVPVDPTESAWSLVVAAPGYDEREAFLPLTGSTGLELVLRESKHRASVTLCVLGPDGAPAAGAWVSVANGPTPKGRIGAPHTLTDRYPNRGRTDAEGWFVTHGILVGDVPVRAQLGAYVAQTTAPVTVPETTVEVRLRPGRTLHGRLRVACTDVACGGTHEVLLRLWNAERMSYWPTLRTVVSTKEHGGTFEIRGAPIGRLRLIASTPCGSRCELEIPEGTEARSTDVGEVVLAMEPDTTHE